MRLLYSTLSSTSSGSFLVAKPRMTSANKIPAPVFEKLPELPPPDFSLLQKEVSSTKEELSQENMDLREHYGRAQTIIRAHEMIEQSREATMVVQHFYLVKQNEALQVKERKKKDDWTILFKKGMGRHLTDGKLSQMLCKVE
jgi:hypothetical protein